MKLKNIFDNKTQRMKFTGKHSKILNKFNLKKFGGKRDNDFDGILNKFDCQPMNPLRQDKVLFPKKLKENKIEFGDSISPRKKRVLTKLIRKNPELIKQKGENSKVYLETLKKLNSFGATQPVVDKKEAVIVDDEYRVGVNEKVFSNKYDIKFIDYVKKKKNNKEIDEKELEQERKMLPKRARDHSAKNNIRRTLTHEFEHVKQVDKEPCKFKTFYDKYKKEEE